MCPGEETIAAYVAGQLARPDRDECDSHLDTCAACQELVAALAKLTPATTDDPERGATLGRYLVLARLGAGGMGVVYAAYDPELDRRVAVKVLRRTRAGDQLRDEARAIARLAHPNVIAVHDVGEADGEVFVAMEHVDGATVREWLHTQPSAAAILDVFVQAGRGLAAAHAAGLVHRDVKPSNIIVGTDGRARVLDFGLARVDDGSIAGTPAYMAPEQKRGEHVDARADQYAFCVALAEALGERKGRASISERVAHAIERGRAEDPAARWPTLDALLAELQPPPSRPRAWIIATLCALVLAGVLATVVVARTPAPACTRAADALAGVWPAPIAAAFTATKVPYAAAAAAEATRDLDAWSERWRAQAIGSCRATQIDRVQPAATHALRQHCLDGALAQLRSVVALATAADAEVVARARTLTASLPAPERCADTAALAAVAPPPEAARVELEALRAAIASAETALLAGRATQVRLAILALRERAERTSYLPIIARAQMLVGRLEVSAAHYAEGITALHAAAHAATAARDLETLADTWIELVRTLGNDVRSGDAATLFDGYATALVAQLPDRPARELQLALARCLRNVTAADAASIAPHCERAISDGRSDVAAAARVKLGHLLRLQGKQAEAVTLLRTAITEAEKLHGAQHPDVAVAHYALGIALISQDDFPGGIAELERSLAIRQAIYPGDNIQIAESLIGLGDALGASGNAAGSVDPLERGLAMLERVHQGASAHAVNAHMLAGMSLQELKRDDAALAHYVRAADIADRSLEHRENLVAMGLRSAARIEADRDRYAAAVPYLERAVRVLERGKAAPADLGQTLFLLGQVQLALGDRAARATISAARASFVAAGAAAQIAEVDAVLRTR